MKTKSEQNLIDKFILVPIILVLVIIVEKMLQSIYDSTYIFSIMTIIEFSLLGYQCYILSKLIDINKGKKINNVIKQ